MMARTLLFRFIITILPFVALYVCPDDVHRVLELSLLGRLIQLPSLLQPGGCDGSPVTFVCTAGQILREAIRLIWLPVYIALVWHGWDDTN